MRLLQSLAFLNEYGDSQQSEDALERNLSQLSVDEVSVLSFRPTYV